MRRADLSVLRRGNLPNGLHPKELLRLFGRPVRRALGIEAPVVWADIGDLRLEGGDFSLRLLDRKDVDGARAGEFQTLSLRSDRIDLAVVDRSSRVIGTALIWDIDLGSNGAAVSITLTDQAARASGMERRVREVVVSHASETLGLTVREP